MSQTEFSHLWRIAQGVEDPQAYAISALKERGVDFEAEQGRINAKIAADVAAGNLKPNHEGECRFERFHRYLECCSLPGCPVARYSREWIASIRPADDGKEPL